MGDGRFLMVLFLAGATACGCGPRAVTVDEPTTPLGIVEEAPEASTTAETSPVTGIQEFRPRSTEAWLADTASELEGTDDSWKLFEELTGSEPATEDGPRDLGIPRVALCTRVAGFGDYDEWGNRTGEETYTFIAHAGQPVIIYAEMEGVSSRLEDGSLWESITSQYLVIHSERDGLPIWEEAWQTASDRSRVRRRSYFTTQVVELPPALSAGDYRLTLRVRDEKTGKEAEQSIRFTMASARR
mgnify:CR=1 FL=1